MAGEGQHSFDVVTRPHDLVEILRLAGDSHLVVELGTATAWTTIARARLVSRSTRRRVPFRVDRRSDNSRPPQGGLRARFRDPIRGPNWAHL